MDYKNNPKNYVLVRKIIDSKEVYFAYCVFPEMTYTIFDDADDAKRTTKDMMESGVRVYNSLEEYLDSVKSKP